MVVRDIKAQNPNKGLYLSKPGRSLNCPLFQSEAATREAFAPADVEQELATGWKRRGGGRKEAKARVSHNLEMAGGLTPSVEQASKPAKLCEVLA